MTRRRLNAREAAEALGISVDALRMRCRRGTLECEHDENGRLHVWLDTDETDVHPQPQVDALIEAKDETISVLREQLESERKAHSEARRLLAAALERIPPQLEAPRSSQEPAGEPQDAPRTDTESEDRVDDPAATTRSGGGDSVPLWHSSEEAPEDQPRRPWWQRWFGG